MGRIIGLDVGERRIGVAVSDSSRTLARPADILRTTGLDGDALAITLAAIRRLDAEEPVSAIVVGVPRRLDGSASEMTDRITRFADRLRDRAGLAVMLQDERLTSVEAERLLAHRDKNWRSRKARLDAAAAAVLLQDYLDGPAANGRVSTAEPTH